MYQMHDWKNIEKEPKPINYVVFNINPISIFSY